MIEGLWTAVFSSGSISGAGVIYLSDGRAVGGDSQYYDGSYTFETETGRLEAQLRVTAFVRGAITLFGAPIPAFTLKLSGSVSDRNASASGMVFEFPSLRLQVQLIKRAAKIQSASPFPI
jgi:hypothetical protein